MYKDEIVITDLSQRKKTSAWEFFSGSYNDIMEYLSLSRVAGLMVPGVLIVSGVYILSNQLWPEFEQVLLEQEGYLEQGTTPLVAGDYIEERQVFLSNPGADYFKSLTSEAFGEKMPDNDPVSENYSGTFYLSIPSIELSELPVESNVDSGSEEIYQRVLETKLAHMRGTGLPVSDVQKNIVIYGHSANGNYYDRTQNPAGAFSRLKKVKIGDEMTIKMEGKEYTYKVQKTKIVNPNDVSIINGSGDKQTLTLFTCFPDGNPAKRLVVIARPVE